MTPLQRVQAKVVEANPDIMELKFGCRIDAKGKATLIEYVGYSNRQHALRAILNDGKEALLLVDNVFTDSILGRDIGLEDVLRTIPHSKGYIVDHVGNFWRMDGTHIRGTGQQWHLGTSLHLQPQPTIDFLDTILSV